MVDWYGNRHSERYTFKRVAWSNWQEHESYDYITSGSIELSSEAELKVTGSFSMEGYVLPNVNDLIRVYYSFADDNGEKVSKALATLFVSYASIEYVDTTKGTKASGNLEGSSVLSALKNKIIGMPMTIAKNSNAVYEAELLIRECGLQTSAEPSVFSLTADHTFSPGTSYLEIVNWLLTSASFTEAHPDAYGVVQLKSNISTQQRNDYFTFANDEKSIMYPKIQDANDWQTSPNVVRLIYNTDDACIVAEASNITGSRASLDARGNREFTFFEEVAELGESNSRANALKELAEEILKEQSCDVEYVTMEHAYVPIEIYEPIKIRYSEMEWIGNAENISINLAPSTKTQTKIKKVLYNNIEISSGAITYRGEV